MNKARLDSLKCGIVLDATQWHGIGLDWAGLEWIGCDRAGLGSGWLGLHCIALVLGSDWFGMGFVGRLA
eukprot:2798356-Lingulodinium_polyedra.AAC.1